MATLDEIVREQYDKNMVLKVCQRQAFDYLSEKKGDLMVSLNTCFGTTFETLAEIEREQGPTTLHGRLLYLYILIYYYITWPMERLPSHCY